MRSDMAKVLVERPRYASGAPSRKKGYRRSQQRTPQDELPKNESMLGRWHGMGKSLNEHLGPLRRFLRSRVGRPWNVVHQELCEHVSFENSVQKHILTHVFDFVARNVESIDGRLHRRSLWGHSWPLRPGEMYICPETRILKIAPRVPQKPLTRIDRNGTTQWLSREGVWWELKLRATPKDPGDLWDVWFERPVRRVLASERTTAYGGDYFALSKRQLSREESRTARKAKPARTKLRKMFFIG